MKSSTIDLLKNFATINQGIVIIPGNVIKTISVMKNLYAEAKVGEVFDKEFAIYDLNELLSTLSLFGSGVEVEYKDDRIEMKSGRSKVKYYYSSPKVIVSPPKGKSLEVNGSFTFTLKKENIDEIKKASSIMRLNDLEISNEGLRVYNSSNVGNEYKIEIDDLNGDLDTPKHLSVENLKMLSRDYNIMVSDKAVEFKTDDESLRYVVAFEVN